MLPSDLQPNQPNQQRLVQEQESNIDKCYRNKLNLFMETGRNSINKCRGQRSRYDTTLTNSVVADAGSDVVVSSGTVLRQ
jgi:hypothetical protein